MMINKEIRRVKTPAEQLEEFKNKHNEYLRRSGSYSIESFKNNNAQIGSPYLNQANHSQKNIADIVETKEAKQLKFRKQVDEMNHKLSCLNDNTKSQMRNQILDFELLKLPSISHDEGISFIPTKPVIHSSNTTTKMNSNIICSETKNEANCKFSGILNKSRIDNLPPLQELSVIEQSFESQK